MAYSFCPECGQHVYQGDKYCQNCGFPLLDEPKSATFILRRESKLYFCAAKYDVYLDYQFCGVIKNGGRLSANLPCGIHHLELIDKNNLNRTAFENDFSIDEDGLVMSFSAAWDIKMIVSKYTP